MFFFNHELLVFINYYVESLFIEHAVTSQQYYVGNIANLKPISLNLSRLNKGHHWTPFRILHSSGPGPFSLNAGQPKPSTLLLRSVVWDRTALQVLPQTVKLEPAF